MSHGFFPFATAEEQSLMIDMAYALKDKIAAKRVSA